MEALLKLFIDIEKEIAFLYGPAAENAKNDIEFTRISKVIAELVEARNHLKMACAKMSDGYSGEIITRYSDIVCWGRWREYA